jgi:hypothetical protein
MASKRRNGSNEEVSLSQAAEYLLEECRMVLPGIQALFGFQLIAVFSDGFHDRLTRWEQSLHLVAIGFVASAVAVIMTPAAYHRQRNSRVVTEAFLRLSNRLLLASMIPLSVAICLDFFIIARQIVGEPAASISSVALFGLFLSLWFVFPRRRKAPSAMAGHRV